MHFLLSALCACVLLVLLEACGGAQHRDGLEWNGTRLPIEPDTESPGSSTTSRHPVSSSFPESPVSLLRILPGEWGSSLEFFEFSGHVPAYLAFQGLASLPEEFRAGYSVIGDRVYFLRGRWIGGMDLDEWPGMPRLEANLSVPSRGREDGVLPAHFSSLLHHGRIAGTERILHDAFLGRTPPTPVYAVQMDCHGDTAWLFAAYGIPPTFGRGIAESLGGTVDSLSGSRYLEIHAATPAPLRLRFTGHGMVGSEGCFDKKLTEYWLKMQQRALKQLK